MESLTDAVRCALEQAAPDRIAASWGHTSGINIAGMDERQGAPSEYVTMVLASIISGAGATKAMDGWHSCGPLCCFGAVSSGDIELLEHSYPIVIHRYGLAPDSGGAGEHRGGCGTIWEVEPLDHTMSVIGFGEGRQKPTLSAGGAYDSMPERKLGRLEVISGEKVEKHFVNVMVDIEPGQRARNINPGGGGYGDPKKRDADKVAMDVRNGIVSIEAAVAEYGVAMLPNSFEVDQVETQALRAS
jgi:N-methylhydantoinase B